MPEVNLEHIAKITGGTVVGDGARVVGGLCSPDDAKAGMLCVVWEKGMLEKISEDVPVLTIAGALSGRDGIEHPTPKAALISLLEIFDRRIPRIPGIHPAAVIHETARIGADVVIAPGCVISEGAVIGDRVVMHPNVFVGRGVLVGEDSIFEPSVSLLDFVEIGRRVILHAGTVIGCDGFGFLPVESGEWKKIPQIGTTIIEDDVEIGANCSVDRATFGVTRVRRGTKLGALVHIAHNCDIGEDCVMVGFVGLSGSVRIGRHCVLAGMSGVADHVTIGDDVTVAGRAGVTKNVKSGETVSGFPAQDHRRENRYQASLRRVPDMAERLKALEAAVGSLKAQHDRAD